MRSRRSGNFCVARKKGFSPTSTRSCAPSLAQGEENSAVPLSQTTEQTEQQKPEEKPEEVLIRMLRDCYVTSRMRRKIQAMCDRRNLLVCRVTKCDIDSGPPEIAFQDASSVLHSGLSAVNNENWFYVIEAPIYSVQYAPHCVRGATSLGADIFCLEYEPVRAGNRMSDELFDKAKPPSLHIKEPVADFLTAFVMLPVLTNLIVEFLHHREVQMDFHTPFTTGFGPSATGVPPYDSQPVSLRSTPAASLSQIPLWLQ